jgi:hypothetical protein
MQPSDKNGEVDIAVIGGGLVAPRSVTGLPVAPNAS